MLETENRTAEATLNWLPLIYQAPYKYDFYTVMRCLECAYHNSPRLGDSTRLKDDGVRLAQQAFLHCPSSDIADFQPATQDKPAELRSYLFGLFGPNGPLPIHITDYIRQRSRQQKDPTASAFFNLFHHRLLSFYYRAWADSEPVTQLDRPHQSSLNKIIYSLGGAHRHPDLSKTDKHKRFTPLEQCYYTGRLSPRHCPAEGLAAILCDYFGLTFKVEPLIPRWVAIPPQDRMRLQQDLFGSQQLGRSTIIGQRVRTAQQQINIVAYCPNFARFYDFLPHQYQDLTSLIAIVQRYLGNSVEWRLILKLKKHHIPQWQLGKSAQLGWTLWLSTPQFITQQLLKKQGGQRQKKNEEYIDVTLNPMAYRKFLTACYY